jgi:hypothetical protein
LLIEKSDVAIKLSEEQRWLVPEGIEVYQYATSFLCSQFSTVANSIFFIEQKLKKNSLTIMKMF